MNQEHEENELEDINDETDETPEGNSDIRVKQDTYRHVVFGQIADGLIPPHQGPPETTEDELTAAALSDTATPETDSQPYRPTIWRALFLVILAVVSLAILFWKK